MTYRKLAAPVKAKLVSWKVMDTCKAPAGSVHFNKQKDGDQQYDVMWYVCPCGCGSVGCIHVGINTKPENVGGRATWNWNGDKNKPTLTPSIDHKNNWHGFLTDGYFRDA